MDDEPEVLDGLKANLRRHYDVHTAKSGAIGLATLRDKGPFAVVLSDMRMPAMQGTSFLNRVREAAPETVRILLTGQADLNAAIDAVNEGQVFRFLTKPCPPPQLFRALQDAIRQHRLLTAEKELLEETLFGSIKTLTEILSMVSPTAFGRALRLKVYARKLADTLGARTKWQIEVAAMLSQLGCVTLPNETAEKLYYGHSMTEDEMRMADSLPDFSQRLLRSIPRLEEVREIVLHQKRCFNSLGAEIPLGSRILKVALDYDVLQAQGTSDDDMMTLLRSREGNYDPQVLDALESLLGEMSIAGQIQKMYVDDLRAGMIFADDITSVKGSLLIARGNEVTDELLTRLSHLGPYQVKEPFRILIPEVD